MNLKLVSCLCFCFTFTQNVKSQRINSWGSSQSDLTNSGDSRFSSWNTNQASNLFSANENSDFNSWESKNEGPSVSGFGNVPTWESNSFSTNNNNNNNNNNNKFNTVNGNKRIETWASNSFSSNNRPKEDSSSFGFEGSQNSNREYETYSNKRKSSPTSGWNSNKFTSNERPKEQKSSNENWQSDSSSANNRPKEQKSSSVTKFPTSGTNWNVDSNKFSSSSGSDKNSYSNWGSQNSRPDVSNSHNSGAATWGSNSANNNNNKPNGNNEDSVWDAENNSVYSPFDTESNENPSFGSNSDKNSNSGSWDSKSQNNKKTEWSSNNNRKSNDKKSSSSNNSKPSGSNNWSSSSSSNSKPTESESSNYGNDKSAKDGNRPTDVQNERKSSLDTSILDELDKNEWYFGSEDNYPEPPFKTNLNIDVSALWNFDKNSKKTNQNSDRNSNNKNKRRRNRETDRLGMKTRGGVCECVDVNLCDYEDMIITKKDAGNDGPLSKFRCKKLTEVCCRKPKVVETSRESDGFEENDGNSLQCGQRRLRKSFYEGFEGGAVQPGEFPWIIRLRSFKNDVECDGSLIHPKLVLTAAHCVEGVEAEDLSIVAGVWNSNDEPSQSRNVLDIIPHPDYNRINPRNDIALLVLEVSLELTDNVNTICLPVTNDKWDLNGCFVADWRSNQINGKASEILSKGKVEFLPQYECQNILLVTEFWRKYILHDSFVCAVEKNGQDKCLGEEGGPLVCPSKKLPDTYLQIGIVSKSLNCDDVGGPGIMTNVLQFLDWINKNIFDLDLYYDIDIRSL